MRETEFFLFFMDVGVYPCEKQSLLLIPLETISAADMFVKIHFNKSGQDKGLVHMITGRLTSGIVHHYPLGFGSISFEYLTRDEIHTASI